MTEEEAAQEIKATLERALPTAYAVSALVGDGDMRAALELAGGDALAVAVAYANLRHIWKTIQEDADEESPPEAELLDSFQTSWVQHFRGMALSAASSPPPTAPESD